MGSVKSQKSGNRAAQIEEGILRLKNERESTHLYKIGKS